jgi:MFS family permease
VFLPIFVFSLPAGDVADRVDRRVIVGAVHFTQATCAALFIALTATASSAQALGGNATWPFFAVLALSGTARAFSGPAVQSFTPFLVPREQFANAVGWSASSNQTATVLGPALGGVIYLLGPGVVFAACLAMSLTVAAAMFAIRTRVVAAAAAGTTALSRVISGIVYLRRQPVVLGAISLDLFAVLLGGITALLPIYARDILGVGPDGMGLMRSSIAVGAVGTALVLANLPARRLPHAGRAMLLAVALFGVAVLFFGLSASFAASLIALAVMGASDMVSVFVRSTVVQLATPDAMRGRISALHMLFVNAANELGEFRAGIVAAWLGAVPAVLLGGIGSLVVVGLWAYLFPELRRIDRLADVSPRR